jgi:hypothetical protein
LFSAGTSDPKLYVKMRSSFTVDMGRPLADTTDGSIVRKKYKRLTIWKKLRSMTGKMHIIE